MTQPASRAGRRARQRRERRRAQVRRFGGLLAVLALVAAAFGVYLAVDSPEPAPAPAATGRTQSTVLLQVRGATGEGVANALLGQDTAAGTGSVVLIPPQVIVTVPGSGPESLGKALASSAPETSQAALSDLMGVTVDHSWILTVPALTSLVDAAGGLDVDVDVPVEQGGVLLINPGPQRLDGIRASAFVTYLAEGEQEQARLARIQEVLDGLLDALPPTAAELATLLGSFGGGSITSTLPPLELADFLMRLEASDDAGRLQYDVLPVIPIDTGGGQTSFRIDGDRIRGLADRLFAGSVPPGVREEGNRVLVLNGVGTPGLGEVVRGKLVPEGFVFVGSRNAPSFGVATTQVLIPSATPEAQALGARVAKALGVPPSSIATQSFGSVADVVVLVGEDFAP